VIPPNGNIWSGTALRNILGGGQPRRERLSFFLKGSLGEAVGGAKDHGAWKGSFTRVRKEERTGAVNVQGTRGGKKKGDVRNARIVENG